MSDHGASTSTPASTHTHIDESRVVSLLEVVQHRGLIQAGELRHVFHLVELGWVHLLNVILVYFHLRFSQRQRNTCQTGFLNNTFMLFLR